jgi:hypothetical protein
VVLGAGKARLYGLRRNVQGVDVPIPIFRVSEEGGIRPIGYLDVLQGEFYATIPLTGSGYDVFKGLPFFTEISGLKDFGAHRARQKPGFGFARQHLALDG